MGLGECLDALQRRTGFSEKHRRLTRGKGIGIAGSAYISGAGLPIYWNEMPHSGAEIRVDRAGGVTVMCGTAEIGQGSDMMLASGDAAVLAESKHGTLVAAGSYKPPKGIGGSFKGAGVGPSPAYSYQAAVAEVSVDLETGTLTVERITTAHDCGRALNPANVEGQIEGSAYMGYGEIAVEEQVFRAGLHKKPSLLDYKLPTSLDTPALEAIVVETVDAEGPFGAKEAGEGPLNPVIPAIANAVYDAIGVRFDETPITPEKILEALGKRDNRGIPKTRIGPDGLGERDGAPKRALRRLTASTEARERKPAGGRGAEPPD